MNFADFFIALAQISGLLFIVASMLAMGMSLTMQQILQPLKNARLVILALVANFVLVPLLAYAITLVIPLQQDLRTGLIVLATAAGAPFLPKLVQGAKGNIAFGVGLMVLLMVVTIIYLPIVLPLLLPGASINPWDIAKSLIVLMLIPLAIGLMIKTHSPDVASNWQTVMNKISSLSLLILLVVGLGLNISNILNLIGSLGLLAVIIFVLGCLLIGLLLGGRDPGMRSVMGLGTAQRNVSAAILVSAMNFSGTNTLPFVLVAAIILLLILLPAARQMGKRTQPAATALSGDAAAQSTDNAVDS
jgi:predicted Na+-dependent transporter